MLLLTVLQNNLYAVNVKRTIFSYFSFIVLIVVVLFTQDTYAASQSHTCTIARSRLDWRVDTTTGSNTVKHCTLPQFDTSLGTLTKVDVTVTADTDTQQKVENKDETPHTMTSAVTVELDVQRTDGSSVTAVSIPTANESFAASAFDGTLDYGGTSGKTFDVQTGHESKALSFNAEGDLMMFRGTGTYDFPVLAKALWNCSGSGNAACEVDTYASASITVSYTYTPPMPDLVFNSCSETELPIGEIAEYVITASNQGNASTTSTIRITDTLPECLDYVDRDHGAWTCGYDIGTKTATCTFTGTVPPNGFLPELPMSVQANECTNTSLTHVVRVFVDGEEQTQNNSLSCAVTIANTPVTPTPEVTETVLSDEATPTPTPAVLPVDDSDEPSVLAATGLKILIPTLIGALIVGVAVLLRRKKAQAEVPNQ